MKHPEVAIIGGGLLGGLLAWRAARSDLRVALYSAGATLGDGSAAWVAAGMITPAAEAVDADPEIVAMGRNSLLLWPEWLRQLPSPVFYRDTGTLFLWHRQDAAEAQHFKSLLAARDPKAKIARLEASQLDMLEPALAGRFQEGFHLPCESQIDNRELLHAVALALEETGVDCHWHTKVDDSLFPQAELLIDCRGMGAHGEWPQLRGVRGEIARLHAPEIELRHMLRLLHPRYSVYVVPRSGGRLVVGATSIESDDLSPVSVRGVLELLSAAYSMLPALAEARIEEFATQVRPALPDNRPAFRYSYDRRLLRINGLYRHGFLLSPTVVEEALAILPGVLDRQDFTMQSIVRWSCLLPESEESRTCQSL